MSRAFVKELDPVPEHLPDRVPDSGPNWITPAGVARIEDRLSALHEELASVSDEAERERIDRDIRYWSQMQATAQIVEPRGSDRVEFGSIVTIERAQRRQTFQIVGEAEADPATGRINWQAPLADALLGASIGDTVSFGTPPQDVCIVSIDS